MIRSIVEVLLLGDCSSTNRDTIRTLRTHGHFFHLGDSHDIEIDSLGSLPSGAGNRVELRCIDPADLQGRRETATSFVKQKRFGGKYADLDVPLANRVDSPPVWVDRYQVLNAAETRDYVLTNAGARPGDRDPVDRRVVDQVQFDTKQAGGIIASQDDVGDWPRTAAN